MFLLRQHRRFEKAPVGPVGSQRSVREGDGSKLVRISRQQLQHVMQVGNAKIQGLPICGSPGQSNFHAQFHPITIDRTRLPDVEDEAGTLHVEIPGGIVDGVAHRRRVLHCDRHRPQDTDVLSEREAQAEVFATCRRSTRFQKSREGLQWNQRVFVLERRRPDSVTTEERPGVGPELPHQLFITPETAGANGGGHVSNCPDIVSTGQAYAVRGRHPDCHAPRIDGTNEEDTRWKSEARPEKPTWTRSS
ncbi:MAG: hypothetical protein K0S14_399 [Thermomicrobiales bacterium]|nr:hypothetical protein [Thermomicrobiales bacterium]